MGKYSFACFSKIETFISADLLFWVFQNLDAILWTLNSVNWVGSEGMFARVLILVVEG